jgi:hypothetical protein
MEGCGRCHGNAYLLHQGKSRQVEALKKQVAAALEKAREENVSQTAYQNADRNYQMVLKDSGVGYHNPSYAIALLKRSLEYLQHEVKGDSASAVLSQEADSTPPGE